MKSLDYIFVFVISLVFSSHMARFGFHILMIPAYLLYLMGWFYIVRGQKETKDDRNGTVKLDLTPPQGLSHFKFDPNITYGIRRFSLQGGEYGESGAISLKMDEIDRGKGDYLLREWWFEMFIGIPNSSSSAHITHPKGKSTLYKIRGGDKIMKCVAIPDKDKGTGFIKYEEVQIGHIDPWPEAAYDLVCITDYQ